MSYCYVQKHSNISKKSVTINLPIVTKTITTSGITIDIATVTATVRKCSLLAMVYCYDLFIVKKTYSYGFYPLQYYLKYIYMIL